MYVTDPAGDKSLIAGKAYTVTTRLKRIFLQ